MDLITLASSLFGRDRAEADPSITSAIELIAATAATDSTDGTAGVVLDCDVTPADDYEGDDAVLDVPTSPSAKVGDDLLVGLTGSGPLKTPVVISNPGFGDRMQAQIDTTEELVERAEQAAAATSQHFWNDDNGAHVTQATKEDWGDPESADYHSGPNALWNALGVLFRDGLTNLLAVLTNGIAIYDGNGNAPENVLATFAANLVRIGGRFASSGQSSAGVQFFADDSSTSDLTATHYIDTTQDMQVYHDVALTSTTTDELLAGEVEHATSGNVELWQQVYNDGINWSEESNAGLNAKASDTTHNAAVGATVLETSAGTLRRIVYAIGDTLRLTRGLGASAVVSEFAMDVVVQQLTCVPISRGGTGQTTADKAARALGMAKTAGDQWTMNNIITMGFVNNTKLTVNMYFPTPYRFYGASSATVTGTVRFRQYNGTFLLGSSNSTAVNLAPLVKAISIDANGFILINLGNGSAMSGATAHAAVVVQFNTLTIKLT